MMQNPESLGKEAPVLAGIIHQITLPTPFPVGDVEVYLINDEKKVLIDCGCKTEAAMARLIDGLAQYGLMPDDIDELWLTHAHPDHSGLATRLQQEHGVKVGITQIEVRYMQKDTSQKRYHDWFEKHQIPEHLIQAMDAGRLWYQSYYDKLQPDFLIKNGQVLSSGSFEFTARMLPGHSPGHLGFFCDDVFLTGDVLLEKISSNAILTFEHDTTRRVRSLCQLRDSLRFLKEMNGTVFPGHGRPFNNPSEIAQKHLDSHETRYVQTVEKLNEGPGSLYHITKRLFPLVDRPDMTFLCLSETIGFLDLAIDRKDAGFDNDKNIFYPT